MKLITVKEYAKIEHISEQGVSDDEKAIIEWAENDARAELSISERSRLFEHIRKVRDRRNKNGVNQYTKVDSKSSDTESKLEKDRKKEAIKSQDAKDVGLGSGTTASRVKTVVNRAIPEVVKAMDNEEISISKAKNIAVMPEEEQEEALLIATGKKAKYYSDSHKKNSLEEKTLRLMEEDKYGAFSEIKIYPNNPEKSANSIAKQFKHKEPFVIMMMHLGKELIRFGRRNTTRSSEYDDYKSYSFGMTSLSDGEIYDIQEYLDNGNIKKSDICNIYNISLETLKKVEKLTKRP